MKTSVLFVACIIGVVYARPEDAKPQPAPTMCINPPQPSSEKQEEMPAEKPIAAPAEQQKQNLGEKIQAPVEQPAQDQKPAASMGEKYTTKYDNIDLQEILKSERLLKGYFNCLMDKGACTPDGEELKTLLPDALQNACEKCSEKQREGTRTVMHYLIDNRRDLWNELEAKYDKNGEYRKRYQKEAEKEGLKL